MNKVPSYLANLLIIDNNSWLCNREVRWFNESQCKSVFAKQTLIKHTNILLKLKEYIKENKLSDLE